MRDRLASSQLIILCSNQHIVNSTFSFSLLVCSKLFGIICYKVFTKEFKFFIHLLLQFSCGKYFLFVLCWSVFGGWRQLTGQAISKHRHLSTFLNGYFFKISKSCLDFTFQQNLLKANQNETTCIEQISTVPCSPEVCSLNSLHGIELLVFFAQHCRKWDYVSVL